MIEFIFAILINGGEMHPVYLDANEYVCAKDGSVFRLEDGYNLPMIDCQELAPVYTKD